MPVLRGEIDESWESASIGLPVAGARDRIGVHRLGRRLGASSFEYDLSFVDVDVHRVSFGKLAANELVGENVLTPDSEAATIEEAQVVGIRLP